MRVLELLLSPFSRRRERKRGRAWNRRLLFNASLWARPKMRIY